MSKIREELLQLLFEQMKAVMKSMHPSHGFVFGEFTLSRQQVWIIFAVAKNKSGISVKDLSELLGVTSGAVTQFIDVLVEKKLVKRQEDKNDRRIIRIMLTKSAESNLSEFKKNYFIKMSHSFVNLNENELQQLITLLGKVIIPENKDNC